MSRVVITGLGIISSIGNSLREVEDSLRAMKHGFAPFPALVDEPCPPKFYGSISGFETLSADPEDWIYPERYKVALGHLKGMAPHVLFAYFSTLDALADAGLELGDVSEPQTGLYSASGGSAALIHQQIEKMNRRGVTRCSPFGIVASSVGTLNFNLGAILKIKGASCGMASACASSAHALGFAHDAIASGRQDRMIVVGAEDCNRETILGFACMRALSSDPDPRKASCPFDANRTGFVGTGGAATLILESEASAQRRGAKIYAEYKGWGEACDGHSPAMSHPEGEGLAASMRRALERSGVKPSDIDYVSAHATSTPVGDLSEIRALKSVFLESASSNSPAISSTKALTGHPLSMAGTLEAVTCALSIKNKFTPGSAHIDTLDPECEGLNILQSTSDSGPITALSNNSGFGGANVSLIFSAWDG